MIYAAVLLIVASLVSAETDYCSLPSCGGRPHVMCQYPDPGPASTCGAHVARGVTRAEQDQILAAHNDIRQKVKAGNFAYSFLPSATSMPSLSWNAELATLAQRLADQCNFTHDQCRDTASGKVGQNIAQRRFWMKHRENTRLGRPNWRYEVENQWFYDALMYFRQPDLTFIDPVDLFSNKTTGYMTQVIWANTTEVGCGFTQYTQGYVTTNLFVCNYAPSGNVVMEQIYETTTGHQPGAWGQWWTWGKDSNKE